jgi:hypothetical protein
MAHRFQRAGSEAGGAIGSEHADPARCWQQHDAAWDVVEVLRSLWPGAAYAEIAGAGHMSPLTHTARVNDVVEPFLDETT